MKRSEIQSALAWAQAELDKYMVKLPCFANFTQEDWDRVGDSAKSIKQTMLGWDITDFGRGEFEKLGAVLFTLRNGSCEDESIGTPYAEKLIILKPEQRLPIHMHKVKTEDIISRGGAPFEIKLWNTGKDGKPDNDSVVKVYCDGILKEVKPGEVISIEPGNSITLPPYMYHSFFGAKGEETAIIGEVSSVNDDNTDNCFAEPVERFSTIEEDEERKYFLCNEY